MTPHFQVLILNPIKIRVNKKSNACHSALKSGHEPLAFSGALLQPAENIREVHEVELVHVAAPGISMKRLCSDETRSKTLARKRSMRTKSAPPPIITRGVVMEGMPSV